MRWKHSMLTSIAILAGCSAMVVQTAAQDLTQWRGPNRDGVVASFVGPQAWPEQLTQRWKVEVGLGYGSPILVELGATRQIVTVTQGKLVGLDAATGALLWEHPYASRNFTNSITPITTSEPIPKPATLLLLGSGLAGLAGFGRKKRSSKGVTTLTGNRRA